MSRVFEKPIVLVVDGEIGAGKTTLISHLVDDLRSEAFGGLKVVRVGEPVEQWKQIGVLQSFYQDVPRMAYEFQTYTFVTRIKDTIEIVEREGPADVYILERSIFSDRFLFVDMLYQDGAIDEMRMKMYDEWWCLWSRLMPFKPSGFVYLKPDIEECMRRITVRNRDGESGIPEDYQRRLRMKHEEFLRTDGVNVGGDQLAPVLTLNDNGNFRDDAGVRQRFSSRIYNFVLQLAGAQPDEASDPDTPIKSPRSAPASSTTAGQVSPTNSKERVAKDLFAEAPLATA